MTEFDNELRKEVARYRAEHGLKIYEVAKMAEINPNEFYQFTAGNRPLNGERVKRLMDALNLTVELKQKRQRNQ